MSQAPHIAGIRTARRAHYRLGVLHFVLPVLHDATPAMLRRTCQVGKPSLGRAAPRLVRMTQLWLNCGRLRPDPSRCRPRQLWPSRQPPPLLRPRTGHRAERSRFRQAGAAKGPTVRGMAGQDGHRNAHHVPWVAGRARDRRIPHRRDRAPRRRQPHRRAHQRAAPPRRSGRDLAVPGDRCDDRPYRSPGHPGHGLPTS
jgi:hypothetical protein